MQCSQIRGNRQCFQLREIGNAFRKQTENITCIATPVISWIHLHYNKYSSWTFHILFKISSLLFYSLKVPFHLLLNVKVRYAFYSQHFFPIWCYFMAKVTLNVLSPRLYSFSSPIEPPSPSQIKTNYFQRMNTDHYCKSHSPSVQSLSTSFFVLVIYSRWIKGQCPLFEY